MKTTVRFFEAESPTIIMESIYTLAYKDLNCTALRQCNKVTIFFDNFDIDETLNAGYSLIVNSSEFNGYIGRFNDYLLHVHDLSMLAIANNDKHKLVKLFIEFLSYYRWTEFFYTDKVYGKAYKDNDSSLLDRLKILENLKTIARKYIIDFFNGQNSYIMQIANKEGKESQFINSLIINDQFIPISMGMLENHILRSSGLIEGANSDHFIKATQWLKSIYNTNNSVLKGIVASRGLVRAPAFVLSSEMHNYDSLHKIISKMPTGIILVSETTSPDLLCACQKAVGIITNQGGLGSHAAIISRELHIPCIVGTKNATILIKNGDIITMDAFKGVIEINEDTDL